MHMDNPAALAAAIINDVYGLGIPLRPNEVLLRSAMIEAMGDEEFEISGEIVRK